MQGKAEDAGGLTPAKDDNAAMRPLYPRAFARNSDDCYSYCITFFMKIQPEISEAELTDDPRRKQKQRKYLDLLV